MKRIGVFPLLTFKMLLAANLAHANREELVNAPSGGQPYMIVHLDDSEGTTKEPGLYSLVDSKWSPLFLGQVLSDPRRGSFIHLLPLGRTDNRIPAITIVDGQIRLFSVLSESQNPKSYINLSQEPLVELGTGIQRQLPKIANANQVTILASDGLLYKNQMAQLILISLKASEASDQSSEGLTLAVRLKQTDQPTLELDGPSVILDHHFHKAEDLAKMLRFTPKREVFLYSELLQQSHMGRLAVTDHGEHQPLVSRLIEQQRACMVKNYDFCNIHNLANWSVHTGSAVFKDLISTQTNVGAYFIQFDWSLNGGTPTTLIRHLDSDSTYTMTGRARMATNGYLWSHVNERDTNGAALFAVENDLYLALTPNNRISIHKLEHFPDRPPERVSMVARESDADGVRTHYIIVSKQYAGKNNEETKEKVTTLYVIRKTGEEGSDLGLIRTQILTTEYYEEEELTGRFIRDSETGKLVFDTRTPAQGSYAEYNQAFDKATPYLNVEDSRPSSYKYIFTHPILRIPLAAGILYKQFDASYIRESPTGIEFGDKLIHGSLIPRPDHKTPDNEANTYDLLRQASPLQSEKLGQVSAMVYALDNTHRGGERGFRLALQLTSNPGKTSKDRIVDLFSLPMQSEPFSSLQAVRLVPGRKEHSDHFFLIQFFTNNRPPLYYPIKTQKKSGLFEPVDIPLANGETYDSVSPDEFMSRLVYDENSGDLFFVRTPGISPESREFSVFNLRTEQVVYPKREVEGQALKLDFESHLADRFPTLSDESSFSWKHPRFLEDKSKDQEDQKTNDLSKSPLFEQLRQVLEEAADPAEPPRRRIVIVPKEIKDLATNYIKALYLVRTQKEAPEGSRFHRFNRNLNLYWFRPERSSSDEVFENFEIIRSRSPEQGIIVADLRDLYGVDRPTSLGKTPFMIQVPTLKHPDDDQAEVQHDSRLPHILYLLAAGAPIGYEEFRKEIPPVRANTILVGTRKELELIKEQAEPEMAAGVINAFEEIDLPEPTLKSKTAMLEEILTRPDMSGLEFIFDASHIVKDRPSGTLSPVEHRSKILEYAVTRVDALSRPRDINAFSSFIDFLGRFSRGLLTDPIVKRSRKVDKSFIERILKNQFNLPLNPADLPPDDPRNLLASEDAVYKLHRAGMLGEFELKAEIIRLSLAQMNYDATRVMPSTWIWAGEPGTGKTKSWEALTKMLKLKMFNPHEPEYVRQQANGFYVDPARIRKGYRDEIDTLISQLNDFISSPAGSCGFIFFDDLSFASDELGTAIVQWIRNLQNSGGTPRITRSDGSAVSVSIQNLSIGLAMNFTDNKAQLEQFKGEDVSQLRSKIVATGARFGIDQSFVDRFGGVYNFDKFHESVKEPALNGILLEATQKKMARTGDYLIVDPGLVRSSAKAFPSWGARPFLSKMTESIISLPDDYKSQKVRVFAVIPKSEKDAAESESQSLERATTGAWAAEGAEIKKWVASHGHVIELDGGLASSLTLMRLMIPSFRSPILEALAYAIQMDPRFKSERLFRQYYQAPALFSIFDHLARAETIPLKDIAIEESKFGLSTEKEKEELKTLIQELSSGDTPFIVPFPGSGGALSLWPELGIFGQKVTRTESRQDVLRQYEEKIFGLIEKHLFKVLHVQHLNEIKNTDKWLRGLPTKIPDTSEVLGQELTDALFLFLRDFQSQDLKEALNSKANVDPYIATRFFLMALDKAIARLPWAELSQSMVSALHKISQDAVLGQSVGVQNWLFDKESRMSLLRPSTTNLIREMIEFNETVRKTPAADRSNIRSQFESNCEAFF